MKQNCTYDTEQQRSSAVIVADVTGKVPKLCAHTQNAKYLNRYVFFGCCVEDENIKWNRNNDEPNIGVELKKDNNNNNIKAGQRLRKVISNSSFRC